MFLLSIFASMTNQVRIEFQNLKISNVFFSSSSTNGHIHISVYPRISFFYKSIILFSRGNIIEFITVRSQNILFFSRAKSSKEFPFSFFLRLQSFHMTRTIAVSEFHHEFIDIKSKHFFFFSHHWLVKLAIRNDSILALSRTSCREIYWSKASFR
jgi:hypothetical protein